MGMISCDFDSIEKLDQTYKKGYHWTTDKCSIQVKVNDIGQVAIVYVPDSYEFLHPHVRSDNRNFIEVFWDNWDFPESVVNSCANSMCESLPSGQCLCNTEITESRVFGKMPSSADEVFEELAIGAYDPAAFGVGAYAQEKDENGVKAYLVTADAFDTNTVFEVSDEYGRVFRFKNTYERVHIQGAPEYSFRNAPSFMSILNTEVSHILVCQLACFFSPHYISTIQILFLSFYTLRPMPVMHTTKPRPH